MKKRTSTSTHPSTLTPAELGRVTAGESLTLGQRVLIGGVWGAESGGSTNFQPAAFGTHTA